MKYLILLGDGMADWPLPDYNQRTPLEAASIPAMDAAVRQGLLGLSCPIPEGMPPGSDIGNLSMFGYDPRATFCGRAPMEAARQGIILEANQLAFRCNLVTLEDGRMRDFTSGHISTEEGGELIAALNDALAGEFPIAFHRGVSYRHLAVITESDPARLQALVDLPCEPPHNITGQPYESYLPPGETGAWVQTMMLRSKAVLAGHPVNQKRIEAGLLPATSMWLWGQGRAPKMEPYASKFGLTGAVVSAVDLVNGIGTLAGFEVLDVPGMTGWIDTNYSGKIEAALAALDRVDFVYVHVESPDETAHQGRADLKIQAIEDFDRLVVAPALEYLKTHPDLRILIAPDHITAIETKTHAGGPVPFVLCGAGVRGNHYQAYNETEADKTGVYYSQACDLVAAMIHQVEISA